MDLIDRIVGVVGLGGVLVAEESKAAYETDWTGRFGGSALCIVRPETAVQVAEVVQESVAAGVPVLPQGGLTGLVGGGVPRRSGLAPVIISTRRLNWIGEVDPVSEQVTVGAGVTLAELHRHAARHGLEYGVDFASRDSATIGGTIATNAGGLHVVAYGMTRAQVLGVEAVLPDGSIISRLNGLVKDNTGYDLSGLLVGSEGTLGIITAARLRLRPRPTSIVTSLVTVDSMATCLHVLRLIRTSLSGLRAVELMFRPGIEEVCRTMGLPEPPVEPAPVYLLIEVAEDPDPVLRSLQVISEASGVVGIASGVEKADRERLWSYRERHSEAVSALGIPHKLDIAVPIPRLPDLVERLRPIVAPYRPIIWGHLGDGNLHVNVVGPAIDDEEVDTAIMRLVASLGGTISAEHGIGTAKAASLHLSRSNAEIDAMRTIKLALDPGLLFNPGVILSSC